MTQDRRLVLLVNPSAGGGRAAATAAAVERRLAARGVGFRTQRTRDAADLVGAARRVVQAGETPVAVGGDGTASLVVGALGDRTDTAVGLVPAGRGNDVARHLGLPDDPAAAADVLLDGAVRRVDVGDLALGGADGDGPTTPFLSVATCGVAADASRRAAARAGRFGPLAYAVAALESIAALRPTSYRLTVDGATTEHRALLVAVANTTSFGAGMRIAPDARSDDGALDVVVVEHRGADPDRCDRRDRLRLAREMPLLLRGRHLDLPHVRVRRGAEVALEAEGTPELWADGEPRGALPTRFAVRAGGLSLILPAGSAA